MIISYKWLLDYLPETVPVADLSDILTSIGLEVEAIESIEAVKGGLEGLYTGKILTCEKHPNADKLKVTTVDVGQDRPLHIVCGAPNVAAGQSVIVAIVGTTVHPTEGASFLIKKANIRGEDSEGMICAEDEIGLGNSHAGIILLPDDVKPGIAAKEYYKIPETDHAIHIGLTPNRADAMSHIGVASDICAYLSHHNNKSYSVKLPVIELSETTTDNQIKVNIEAVAACKRYTGISLGNVKVGASPEWVQQRLNTIGVRSINNVVDITNYVLHEYGQPLHAFDADKIEGNEINVRFLPAGTPFLSLDGKERTLQGNDLMICDKENGLCLAGVFGGINSGVTEATGNIFLESAYFDPKHIRRTSMHHSLRTDAATHFEKGVDMDNVRPALMRAAQLITEIAGGNITSAITDVYPSPLEAVTVNITYSFIRKLSGKNYSDYAINSILLSLGFIIQEQSDEEITLLVPSNKRDITQPADIVEEILRIDGLNNIDIPQRLNISLVPPMASDRKQREHIAGLLCGSGFHEIVTNSITNSKYYPQHDGLVKMLNSLSSELDILRPSMCESGLEVIAHNCNRKSQDLLLFEFGRIYSIADGKYIEQPQLALWITGNIIDTNWNQKAQKTDIYYLKGVVEKLLLHSGIKNYSTTNTDATTWKWKNQVLCTAQLVPTDRAAEFEVKQDCYFAAINWDIWLKAMGASTIRFAEVPKFPAVVRDIAIVLDSSVTYEQVEQVTKQLKIESLRSFDLFDVFENEKLGAGKKSYALSYILQLQDRTLTDSETDQVMQQLMNAYKTKLLAHIRE
ncbi:MAG: phenylalanine--tRNA ligase subunit beta [Taibaiella sp.]|nr:phenylalanine--tRNA ligase subunit beta [Taibaiella sp.]